MSLPEYNKVKFIFFDWYSEPYSVSCSLTFVYWLMLLAWLNNCLCDGRNLSIFSLLSSFWKNKSRLCHHHTVCVSQHVCIHPQLLNAWTNLYETSYADHGTWAYLNGVLHKSLPSACVSICVSLLSLLGNGSVRTLTRQRIHTQQ
jgi:hypothetical protein